MKYTDVQCNCLNSYIREFTHWFHVNYFKELSVTDLVLFRMTTMWKEFTSTIVIIEHYAERNSKNKTTGVKTVNIYVRGNKL